MSALATASCAVDGDSALVSLPVMTGELVQGAGDMCHVPRRILAQTSPREAPASKASLITRARSSIFCFCSGVRSAQTSFILALTSDAIALLAISDWEESGDPGTVPDKKMRTLCQG